MRFATVLIVLLGGTAAIAESPAEDAGRRLVDEFVHNVVTFEASFEQRLIDADGEVIENTTGTLEIRRPGQFRWSYIEPYEQGLVADGVNIWSYDVDLAQVTVKPQAEALANTPALLLSGADGALDQFEYQGSYVENVTTWVRLVPRNTESGFERVELGFAADTLTRMVFFDNLEQTTLVQLYEVAVNDIIDPARFEFIVPEEVDVVGVPAVADATDP